LKLAKIDRPNGKYNGGNNNNINTNNNNSSSNSNNNNSRKYNKLTICYQLLLLPHRMSYNLANKTRKKLLQLIGDNYGSNLAMFKKMHYEVSWRQSDEVVFSLLIVPPVIRDKQKLCCV
jgi:hypothetical protein